MVVLPVVGLSGVTLLLWATLEGARDVVPANEVGY